MLNFILCDDNLNTLNQISKMLEAIFAKNDFEANISLKTTRASEILDFVYTNSVDVIILDIQLHSNINGLDIANKIREFNKDCYIVFVTAHSEFVFLAYKCKTFDYLCKPITTSRLEETIIRLFSDVNSEHQSKKYIKLDNKNTIINENDIQYIKREGMKIIFHTITRNYEIYSSFAKLENQLPDNFVRCHKSFIANVNNIDKLEPSSNLIHFKNNSVCEIGPKYKTNILKGVGLCGNYK